MFLNSHLLGEVEATCDRVAFVKQGRIVRELPLAGAPAEPELALRVEPVDTCLLEGLKRFGSQLRVDGPIVRMRVHTRARCPISSRWLVAAGTHVHELQVRRKSLEEWFVEVMGEDQRPG